MGVSALELRRRVLMDAPHRVIESGAFVNFDTYVRQKIPVVVNIDPVQAGSGDPSPDNIRNISPWTSLKLTHTGKNIFDADSFFSNLKQSDGTFKGNTNSTGFSKRIFTIPEELNGKTMTFSFDVDSITNGKTMWARYVNPEGSKSNGGKVNSGVSSITKLVQTGGYFITAYNNNATAVVKWFCLKIGDAPENQPFGNTYNIPFPQEAGDVYGGTLTVNKDGTGQLVVDWIMYDEATSGWGYAESQHVFYKTVRIYTDCIPICNMYKGVTSAEANSEAYAKGNETICVRYPTTDRIYIRDDRYTNANDFVNAISGIQIMFKLATPVTYNLTALEVIETLQGINNIYADTGDVTVEFWKN